MDILEQLAILTTNQDECLTCGKTGEYHSMYACTNCGFKKLRNCQHVCKICNVRNYPASEDPGLRECAWCYIDYPVSDYHDDSGRCNDCVLQYPN
jgi:hypothetical protein